MTEARFCPQCGVALSITGQRFCLACGAAIPGATTRPEPEGAAPNSLARNGAASPSLASRPSADRSPTPLTVAGPAGPTTTLRSAPRIAVRPVDVLAVLAPVAVWLAFSLVTGWLVQDIFASTMNGWVQSLPVVAPTLGAVGTATFGLLSSLFAGLGYHLGASVSAGGLGLGATGSAQLVTEAPAMGSLLVVWLIAWGAARHTARGLDLVRTRALVLRSAVTAGLAGLLILLIAQQLGARLGGSFVASPSVGLGPFTIGGSVSGSLAGGPAAGDAIALIALVLFSASLAGAGGAGLVAQAGQRTAGALASAGSVVVAAVVGTLVAVALLAIPYVVAAIIWWLLTAPADNGTGARLLPLLVAYTPNWIAGMAVLATGATIRSGTGGTDGGTIVLSIWSMAPWLVALGAAALLLPGYIGGAILRGRARHPSTPPQCVAVGALSALLLVVLARYGLPDAAVTQAGLTDALAQNLRFSFDGFLALAVGAVANTLAALAGVRSGSWAWRLVKRILPGLRPVEPPQATFR